MKFEDNKIIDKFLDKKNTFAVIGVSRNPKKYGNKVYADLKNAGYKVYPVNPKLSEILGDKCYANLKHLPKKPDVVNIVVPPETAIKIIKEWSNINRECTK